MMKIFSRAGPRCRNRTIEWLTSAILVSFAITTLITPATIQFGAFKYMLALGITPRLFICTCLLLGCSRLCALYYNGRGLPWTAMIRAVGSILGAITFGFMSLSLAFLTFDTGTISLGVGTHALLACAEIYSCLRAGVDANERTNPYDVERT
jgi:hypothetical protein